MGKRIENTKIGKTMADLPVFGGSSQAIDHAEKQGQQQLVESESLPVDMRDGIREKLESLGVVFGEPYSDDPLFLSVQLPDGLSKRSTSHSMWSELVDENGNVLAAIFYKAAFYDRDAFMRPKA